MSTPNYAPPLETKGGYLQKIGDRVGYSHKQDLIKRAPELVAPSRIVESKVWEVKSSLNLKSKKGRFSRMQSATRHRLILVEVHKFIPIQKLLKATDKKTEQKRTATKDEGYEEVYFRIFKPRKSIEMMKDSVSLPARKESAYIKSNSGDNNIDDTDSFTEELSVASSVETNSQFSKVKKWQERYRMRIDQVKVTKVKMNTCVIFMTYFQKDGTMDFDTREIVFSTSTAANDFASRIEKYHHRDMMGKGQLFNFAMRNAKIKSKLSAETKNERLSLLIEIVSAEDLPKGDKVSSDPYVVAIFCDKIVHKTKYIERTLDPIWTIQSRSCFTIDTSIRELFESPFGLTLLIKDYDKISKNELLGVAIIPGFDLYIANEKRMEYEIQTSFAERKDSISICERSAIGGEMKIISESKSDFPLKFRRRKRNIPFKFQPKKHVPKISIRCRRATQHDKDFLHKCYSYFKETENIVSQSITTIATTTKSINEIRGKGGVLTAVEMSMKSKYHMRDGTRYYRVLPGPHPERIDETKWMSNEQLDLEVMQPSETWINLANSTDSDLVFGNLYVEILKCRNLPNEDSIVGYKPDPFVTLIYNDNHTQTEVIFNKNNPMWVPWSQRAFVFPMTHASSQLYLGVLDYDQMPFDDHNFSGRVSIDVKSFCPNTEYLLEYNLYSTARIAKRVKIFGQVMVRLHIDIKDPRNIARGYLSLPPQSYVNVRKKKDFHCIRSTVYGKYNRENFSFNTLGAYVDELKSTMRNSSVYIEEAFYRVILWRSTMEIKIKLPSLCSSKRASQGLDESEVSSEYGLLLDNDSWKKRWLKEYTISIPLYSILTFLTAVTSVNHPILIPSYFFLWIALIFLGSMQFRNSNPDPWTHCKGFGEILQLYVFGIPKIDDRIKPNEYKKEALEFEQFWKRKIEYADLASEERNKALIRAQEEHNHEVGDLNLDISSKIGDLNPLKRLLWPLQMWLGWGCDVVRLVKNVLTWEESYISFVLTLTSLLLSIFLYIVPWSSILYWIIVVLVWGIFGPWMMLVDKFYFSKIKELTKEEIIYNERKKAEDAWGNTKELAFQAQINREHLVKLSAMKKYLFGKFMLKVPVLKFDRFRDTPLSSSASRPIEKSEMMSLKLAVQKSGKDHAMKRSQQITGHMIPKHYC